MKLFAVDESIVCEACGTMKSTETFFTTKENKEKNARLSREKQTNKQDTHSRKEKQSNQGKKFYLHKVIGAERCRLLIYAKLFGLNEE